MADVPRTAYDEHAHGHGHGHTGDRRWWTGLRELVRPHSHDAADSVDDAHRVRAEVGIVVDPALDIVTAHDIATTVHHQLLHQVLKLVAATVHVSPRSDPEHDHHAVIAHHPGALEPGALEPAATILRGQESPRPRTG